MLPPFINTLGAYVGAYAGNSKARKPLILRAFLMPQTGIEFHRRPEKARIYAVSIFQNAYVKEDFAYVKFTKQSPFLLVQFFLLGSY